MFYLLLLPPTKASVISLVASIAMLSDRKYYTLHKGLSLWALIHICILNQQKQLNPKSDPDSITRRIVAATLLNGMRTN
jgi:hypothetical protein